ncbi:polymorphic toxin-type HINT domain-containing protein [Allonocardiopsis opalescens]|uniref:polymorphic toxin-type HINT domain-containing protein n=1 Tax=Allonocardiopsis opalescens TaxID=1144618 RepID=UPI0011B1CE29|nr:polymorphic toxin-type HINT domain-containing protein [Allonocardiopsis opalescens]
MNRWVWRARRHHETGASALEYAALIAVAAALVGILIASGLPARVADGTEAGLCRLFQNPDNAAECEEPGDGSGADGTDGTEGPGSDDPGGGDSSGGQDAADELQAAEEAHADAEDAMDEVWDDILLELVELAIPLEDIEACLTEGDIIACITALIDLVPWTKALKLARRLPTIWRLANRFLDRRRELEQARERLDDARDACRRRSSFVPGTPVLLADGSRVPIEYVEVGDHVLATDPATGRTSAEPVTDLITTSGIKILVEVGVAGGGTLTATDTHPFWLQEDGEWVGAAELEVGDRLTVPGGGQVAVESLDTRVRPQRVHNLTVAEHHTYYVTAGSTDLLVHNTTVMCPPDDDRPDDDRPDDMTDEEFFLQEDAALIAQHSNRARELGFSNNDEFTEYLAGQMREGSGALRQPNLRNGRSAWYDSERGVIIILNENAPTRSTAYTGTLDEFLALQ